MPSCPSSSRAGQPPLAGAGRARRRRLGEPRRGRRGATTPSGRGPASTRLHVGCRRWRARRRR
eukprot:9616641-Alexandrium_andersonii.AAC.1